MREIDVINIEEISKSIDQRFRHIKTVNIKRFINSALMMFIVCESMMNTIITSILPIDNILGFVMLLLGVSALVVQRIKINNTTIIIVLYCLISFCISGIRGYYSDSILYFIQFMSFGMIGVVGAKVDFDYNSIFKASVAVSEIFIVLNLINSGLVESDFNYGYAVIPGVLSSLVLIYNSLKAKRYGKMVMYLCLATPIIMMFLLRSSRGNLAQLIVFLLLGMFFLFGYKKLAAILTISGIVALANLREIVSLLYEWANAHGLSISVILKTYYLLNTTGQGFSHGRADLFDIFKQNVDIGTFVLANGIGSFEHIAGTYSHNIFLSAFSEFGIIGIIFIVILLVKFFKVLQNSKNLHEKEFVLLIFTLSVVKLCFSGVYWNSSTFWYLVSYLF